MKYNKWTVALAALGVVSLTSAAKAEEKASPVMTALAATTISGYVDTSAQWNPGTGNANVAPYKFNSSSKADGFNLDVIQLTIQKPLDESDWAAGYRADLWFGPDANTLNTTSTGDNTSDFALRQAYVALRAPIGTGLDFKMGVFDSIIGYESLESGNNPNYTRSYGNSIEPQTLTGILTSYRFCDAFSMSFGIANTVGSTINERAFATPQTAIGDVQLNNEAESYKAYAGSFALTAPDSWGFLSGSTFYSGIISGFGNNGYLDASDPTAPVAIVPNGNQFNYYAGATIATPVTGLRFGMAFDYMNVYSSSGETYAIGGYASMQATEKLSFHLRGEYLKDSTPVLFGLNYDPATDTFSTDSAKILALTATVQYDLWKNVISRLEVRWDHSLTGADTFGGTTYGEPDGDNAWMLAANIIYKF